MNQTMTHAEIVRRGYQAFNEADLETLTNIFAERATWTTPGRSSATGVARGRDAVFAQFGRYGGETEGTFRAALSAVFDAEDGRVVGLHHNTGMAQRQAARHRLLHRVRVRRRTGYVGCRALPRSAQLGRLLVVRTSCSHASAPWCGHVRAGCQARAEALLR